METFKSQMLLAYGWLMSTKRRLDRTAAISSGCIANRAQDAGDDLLESAGFPL
jgi:hypothetical protein